MYQYPENIFAAVRQERDDFLYNEIQLVDGLTFSQYRTIKKIHKYYNSHYDLGDYEVVNGVQRKKVFFNINKWRCDVSTKMLDIDVKDFLLISENPATELNVYLLEKEMKYWLKKHKLGKVLNEVVRKLPVYGSCVLKKTKSGAEVVDLRHFYIDQAAESLKTSRYIIQKHLMTPAQLRKMKGVWNNVDQVIENCTNYVATGYDADQAFVAQVGSPYAEIFERYAEVPASYLTNDGYLGKDNDEYVMARFIVAGVDQVERNDKGEITGENGIVLFSEKVSELPFKEVHYNKTEGRWLGIGVVEDCFEDQRRVNEIRDQEAKAMELSSMILLQTKDDLIQKNALADLENGDIVRVRSELTQVNMTAQTGEFNSAANAYEQHADRMTFSYDVIRGETPAASATATSVINQAQQASSVFDYKRENIGLFIQEFITDLVFPELAKKLNTPHVFRFAASVDEMNRMRDKAIDGYIRQQILAGKMEVPTAGEIDLIRDAMRRQYMKAGNQMWIDVEKDFFQNLDYEVSLEITGESKNVQTQLTNLGIVLGELGKNPQLLQNPVLKKVFFKQMSLMGMSPSELDVADSQLQQNPMAGVPQKMGQSMPAMDTNTQPQPATQPV